MSDHHRDVLSPPSMGTAEREQMARKHIFCVNGAAEFLDLLRELLQDERYNVTTSNYVPRTFDQIAALQPDLIVVDLVVAVQAGWDLLERLHHDLATRNIPLIVTSTDQRLLDQFEAQRERYGSGQVLVKPFSVDALIDLIRQLIGVA